MAPATLNLSTWTAYGIYTFPERACGVAKNTVSGGDLGGYYAGR